MGGFTHENNKNNPRIYKNSEEFASCSSFVKEFRIALRPMLKNADSPMLHQRLMAQCSKIKLLDSNSAIGRRNVGEGLKTQKGKLLLRDFVFTPKVGIRQMLGNPEIAADDFRLTWKNFDPSAARFPKGATHFELTYYLMAYDPEVHLFTTHTAPSVRRSRQEAAEQLNLTLEEKVAKKGGVHYIPMVGLRFFEVLGQEEYANMGKDGVGMAVLGVL